MTQWEYEPAKGCHWRDGVNGTVPGRQRPAQCRTPESLLRALSSFSSGRRHFVKDVVSQAELHVHRLCEGNTLQKDEALPSLNVLFSQRME